MKSHDELKQEMELIQVQMDEARKEESRKPSAPFRAVFLSILGFVKPLN